MFSMKLAEIREQRAPPSPSIMSLAIRFAYNRRAWIIGGISRPEQFAHQVHEPARLTLNIS